MAKNFYGDDECLRCGKRLDHAKSTWLELNQNTGLYCTSGTVPPEQSRGGFEFGTACARAILKNGGELQPVGKAARNAA